MSNQKVFDDLNARLTALETRLTGQETTEGARIGAVHATSHAITNATIAAGATLTTPDLRGSNGVPANAKGVFVVLNGAVANIGQSWLAISASNETPNEYNALEASADWNGGTMMVNLGPDGKLKVGAINLQWNWIYLTVVGWWR